MKLDPIFQMEVYNGKIAYLIAKDKTFFKENGFLVVRDTLDPQVVSEAQDVLGNHMGQVSEPIARKNRKRGLTKAILSLDAEVKPKSRD